MSCKTGPILDQDYKDTLGVPYYPYAEMFQGSGNIRVRR